MIENGICCFTGHRDFERSATPLDRMVFEKITDNLIRYGYTTFIAGGALGFDTVAAEYILRRRAEGCAIRLELVLPCADQDCRWSPAQKRRYRRILEAADAVECLHESYVDGCMHERNRRMVDRSTACVAFCQQSTGGTASTVRYAAELGIAVYNIAEMVKKL